MNLSGLVAGGADGYLHRRLVISDSFADHVEEFEFGLQYCLNILNAHLTVAATFARPSERLKFLFFPCRPDTRSSS